MSANSLSDNQLIVKLWHLMDALRDPILVANFQNYFGVHYVNHSQTDSCNDEKNNYRHYNDKSLTNRLIDKWSHLNEPNTLLGESGSDTATDTTDTTDGESADDSKKLRHNCDYMIANKFWYYLFCFGASLGYELFYASFFPMWFWSIDSAVGRRLVLIWVIIMYIGQALKDVIQWSRPTSPPVVVLEPEYAVEYGMPSTHAMVGTALPVSLIVFTMNRYEYPIWIGIVIAIIWCSLVCGSRLYLGMHSILDIIAGILLTVILLIIIIPLVDAIDQFHLTSSYSPLFTIPLIVILAVIYPKPKRWSPARGDTCVITGSGAGILLGSWLNFQLGIIKGPPLPPPFPIIWPGYGVFGLSLLRLTIGILCIVAARAIGKVFIFSMLCYIRNLDPRDPKTKIHVSVEIPCKVITYMTMGITITYLSPLVFRILGIERVSLFTEV